MPILRGKVKASPEKLVEAMHGKLSIEDGFLLEQSLDYFQFLKAQLNKIQILIEKYVQKHFPLEYALLLGNFLSTKCHYDIKKALELLQQARVVT